VQNKPAGERPARRGRNRRRNPRNTGDRRQEQTGSEGSDNQSPAANNANDNAPRPYASEFAERKQRVESEPQEARPSESSSQPTHSAAED